MSDVAAILLYSCFMFIGSCAAGCIPLLLRPAGSKSKLVAIFGAGVLFGAALALIIPEGLESSAGRAARSPQPPPCSCTNGSSGTVPLSSTQPLAAAGPPARRQADGSGGGAGRASDGDASTTGSGRGLAGLALVAGFTLMLFVDQLSGGHEHANGRGGDDEAATDGDKSAAAAELPTRSSGQGGFAATVGLIVHGLADGVALGAAASTADGGGGRLSAVVFAAIMLHKAPASFGLSTFLMHSGGLSRPAVCWRVLAFAASAPAAALVAFFSFAAEDREALRATHATGYALLFSGGTFVYVAAVSVLPEVSTKRTRTVAKDGTVTVSETRSLSKYETLAIALGALLPVLVSFGRDD